jgi:hypothetical protein
MASSNPAVPPPAAAATPAVVAATLTPTTDITALSPDLKRALLQQYPARIKSDR